MVHFTSVTKGGLEDDIRIVGPDHRKHGKHHKHHRSHKAPFSKHLTFTLRALGLWEGRAVAFVLGTSDMDFFM